MSDNRTSRQPDANAEYELKARQDWRESRLLFLEEWRLNVDPPRIERLESLKFATQYAQIALRGAFLVNSGALVALPPLMGWLHVAGGRSGASAALWFVVGLFLAAASAIAAYANFLCLANVYDARWSKAAIDVSGTHYPKSETPPRETEEYIKHQINEDWYEKWVWRTQVLSLSLGIGSYVAFVTGAEAFRNLIGS